MKQYINTCIEIEKTVGRIYRRLSETSDFGSEVRQVFLALANDEDDHAQQLDFSLRLPTGTIMPNQDMSLDQAKALLSKAEKLCREVSIKALSVAQAIDLGIALEGDFCHIHLNNSVKFQDKNMQKMFSSMAKSEENHKRQLVEFKSTLERANS